MSDDMEYAFRRGDDYIEDYWTSWRWEHLEPGQTPPDLEHVYARETPFGATHRERAIVTIRFESVVLPPTSRAEWDAFYKQQNAAWEAEARRQQRADRAHEKRLREEVRVKCEREHLPPPPPKPAPVAQVRVERDPEAPPPLPAAPPPALHAEEAERKAWDDRRAADNEEALRRLTGPTILEGIAKREREQGGQ